LILIIKVMAQVIEFLSSPSSGIILKVAVVILMAVVILLLRLILNRIRLLEYKHVAVSYALAKSFGNGFSRYYYCKLNELKADYKFRMKGE